MLKSNDFCPFLTHLKFKVTFQHSYPDTRGPRFEVLFSPDVAVPILWWLGMNPFEPLTIEPLYSCHMNHVI